MKFTVPVLRLFCVMASLFGSMMVNTGAAAEEQERELLDLFFTESYVKSGLAFGEYETCETCRFSSSPGDCSLSATRFQIQNVCLAVESYGNEDSSQPSRWRTVQLVDNQVVQSVFSDPECTELISPEDSSYQDSTFPLSLDTCADGEQTTRFPDYCIKSDTPTGSFVVPFAKIQHFEEKDLCESGNATDEFLFAADPDFCEASSVLVNEGQADARFVPGSFRSSCQGDGAAAVLGAEAFLNTRCRDEDNQPGLNFTRKFSTGTACSLTAFGNQYRKANCDAVQLYCKDFSSNVDSVMATSGSPNSARLVFVYGLFLWFGATAFGFGN